MPDLLIAGCGFLGEAAAAFFSAAGWRVVGLTGSAESAARLTHKPYRVEAADITDAGSLARTRASVGPFDFVLHCASSGRGGAGSYQQIYVNGCARLAEAFPEARLLFTSSTSVYAQTDGAWVDEDSPAAPDGETGRLLLEAERIVRSAGGCVLRLGGIYGPGRSVLLRKFLDGRATLEEGGGRWINQIHRDDAARAIFAVAEAGAAGAVINVVDDEPATQRTVHGWIADFLGQPMPPDGPADRNRKRGWTSKRVSNARLRALGWEPDFPSYRAALPSVAGTLGVGEAGGGGVL
ncbi:MAG: NAD-dependent epimerase/dehydratase family protein [Terrimicrobiaceae bacterium]|nr:NAD-dependent epimerase/dehydratase family protein [Terrimicrobiaceae bacterium]